MIRLATETVVTLGRAPRHLPRRRGDKKTHPSTVYRWAKEGVRADDGTLVVLETVRVGRTLCTSAEAIQRFCDRLTAARAPALRPDRELTTPADAERLESEAQARGL